MICIPTKRHAPKMAYLFSDEQLKEFARQHELIGERKAEAIWRDKFNRSLAQGKEWGRDEMKHQRAVAFACGVIVGFVFGLML